jgi:riboflavin synthase
MFTGIIEETGVVRSLRKGQESAEILISARVVPPTLKVGDSIAVNGVCLTVVRGGSVEFSADLSAETLERSSLGRSTPGRIVNLERSLVLGARLGGHFVQGHVDGVGRLLSVRASGDGAVIAISYPAELERYLVYKGSIAVEGISLTVSSLRASDFEVAVIPHTWDNTNLHLLKTGDLVNLETDILAKYFERYYSLGIDRDRANSNLTVEYLREQGF